MWSSRVGLGFVCRHGLWIVQLVTPHRMDHPVTRMEVNPDLPALNALDIPDVERVANAAADLILGAF